MLKYNQSKAQAIPIGVIGPALVVEKMLRVIQDFPSFVPVPRVFASEEEAPELAVTLIDQVEVLLLSGPLVHRKVREKMTAGIPIHHVPITDASLYKALVSSMQTGRLTGGVSIDTLTEAMVIRALQDLELKTIPFVSYDGPAYASVEELVRFHRGQYVSGTSSVAFTGVESVAQELTGQGIPNQWLMPSDRDIVVALERALLSTETRRIKEAQIVVGMINVDDFGKLVRQQSSEHEVQKLKLNIHRMVLDYVESLEGYLTHLGGDDYLFFTTRGIFERETGGYKTIPLAKDAKKTHGLSLSIGIGFGLSANEAGTNARAALGKAKETGGNACFIVREDMTLIGPLEMAEPVQSVLALTDAEFIRRAESAGMTSAYLSKLLNHKARTGKFEFKAHELASLLDITVRSVHRLLQLWMDHNLVEIAWMEKVPKGRPRQVYRFMFLIDSP